MPFNGEMNQEGVIPVLESTEIRKTKLLLIFHGGGPYHIETSKSMDSFLYDRIVRLERVKNFFNQALKKIVVAVRLIHAC